MCLQMLCVCLFITCAVALLPDAVNHVLQIAEQQTRNVAANDVAVGAEAVYADVVGNPAANAVAVGADAVYADVVGNPAANAVLLRIYELL